MSVSGGRCRVPSGPGHCSSTGLRTGSARRTRSTCSTPSRSGSTSSAASRSPRPLPASARSATWPTGGPSRSSSRRSSSGRCCSRCSASAAGSARSPCASCRRSARSCTGCSPGRSGFHRGPSASRSPAAPRAPSSTSCSTWPCWRRRCGSSSVRPIAPVTSQWYGRAVPVRATGGAAAAARPARQDDLPGRARRALLGHTLVFLLPFVAWCSRPKLMMLALWWGAATSKLNKHFPFVVATMLSNAPLVLRRSSAGCGATFRTTCAPHG